MRDPGSRIGLGPRRWSRRPLARRSASRRLALTAVTLGVLSGSRRGAASLPRPVDDAVLELDSEQAPPEEGWALVPARVPGRIGEDGHEPVEPASVEPTSPPRVVVDRPLTAQGRPATVERLRHVIDGNAAAALVGRYGLAYEFLPFTHHALVIGAYRQSPSLATFVNGGLVGVGGEIGWRFYSGRRGPSGWFFGPSALIAYHTTESTPWFRSVGGAVDVGWSYVTRPETVGRVRGGLHFAVGAGVQLVEADVARARLTELAAMLVGPGIAPRAQVVLGSVL